MCGIIGLLLRRDHLHDRLGEFVTPMVRCMETRGPDSAGLAVFRRPLDAPDRRFGLYSNDPEFDWEDFCEGFQRDTGNQATIRRAESHSVLTSSIEAEDFRRWLAVSHPTLHVLAVGRSIEMYKDEGLPGEIADRYGFRQLSGTHAVGHTRMATESDVDIRSAHPYWAYPFNDVAVVHNGQLTNYWNSRREMYDEMTGSAARVVRVLAVFFLSVIRVWDHPTTAQT